MSNSAQPEGIKALIRGFFPPFAELKTAAWIPTSISKLTVKSVLFQMALLVMVSYTADFIGKATFS